MSSGSQPTLPLRANDMVRRAWVAPSCPASVRAEQGVNNSPHMAGRSASDKRGSKVARGLSLYRAA
eukprot:2551710-Alexandrium_andersonii.AAC.1